jgi:hypothetical protein
MRNGNGNGIKPGRTIVFSDRKKRKQAIVESQPLLFTELDELIDKIIKPKKIGKSRFIVALLENYDVVRRAK